MAIEMEGSVIHLSRAGRGGFSSTGNFSRTSFSASDGGSAQCTAVSGVSSVSGAIVSTWMAVGGSKNVSLRSQPVVKIAALQGKLSPFGRVGVNPEREVVLPQ